MIGDQRRQADAEVDDGPVGNIPCHQRRHLGAAPFARVHAAPLTAVGAALKPPALVATRATLTMRCTKMPGVTTASGSSSPSATIWCTVAIVVFAAIAITGPKLRGVIR